MKKIVDYIDSLIPYWFFRAIKRSIEYAIHGWKSYDFDDGYLDQDILFKLKRIEKQLIQDSSFVEYDKEVLQSLRIAIKLMDRLVNGEFRCYSDVVDRKWGELELYTPLIEDNAHFVRTIIRRTKVVTAEQDERSRVESSAAYEKDQAHEKRYRELFFKVLGKYQKLWWS